MKIHILGICGTFMGGIAALAREAGYEVEGSDQGVYPPMSTQLEQLGIQLKAGYKPENVSSDVDQIIIGNALSRGNSAVEWVLNQGLPYFSGPEWLAVHVLAKRKVIAIAGTHGKTTTSSLVAWILESAGLKPGFLIGGVPANFGVSARLGEGEYFVVEADEYDTAFFDKRSKFVHYHPQIAVLNNLEFDHADIFDDLAQIQKQFHHLVRTIPGNGQIISNAQSAALDAVLEMGCWTPVERFAVQDKCEIETLDQAQGQYQMQSQSMKFKFKWELSGEHNLQNAQAGILAAHYAGVCEHQIVTAMAGFKSVARRMQLLSRRDGLYIYEDFAHHPTAIRLTLEAMRSRHPGHRLIAVIEPRSNSMREGAHAAQLPSSIASADRCFVLAQNLNWDTKHLEQAGEVSIEKSGESLLNALKTMVKEGDVIVFMSNGSFEGIQHRFAQKL
ncbi:MAG: UDP-N-acetylmuramate:L-alanyl-gamma-D-glutamyl-meso-diaminopimelate ligase [bacterium]